MTPPNLRDALQFDDNGECIGIKASKDISPEVRAAWDKMLGESYDLALADYLARLEALGGVCPPRLRVEGEEFTKMVMEGAATEAEFVNWSIAKASGLVPLLPSDVANELYDRVKARDQKGEDRTTWPEGMTYFEWNKRIVQNSGAKGRPVRDANAKRKNAAKVVIEAERNKPRMEALNAFRRTHPEGNFPEAAAALVDAHTAPNLDTAKKWLARLNKAGAIVPPLPPGIPGRPPKV